MTSRLFSLETSCSKDGSGVTSYLSAKVQIVGSFFAQARKACDMGSGFVPRLDEFPVESNSTNRKHSFHHYEWGVFKIPSPCISA